MAIRIKSRGGETAEQMLRRFKKLCEKEGLTKDIKRKEYYEKPSERNRRAVRKAIGRRIREELGPLALGPKGKRGPGGPEREGRGERGERGPGMGGMGGGMGY
jgi:small subunit ribosomal protein S21